MLEDPVNEVGSDEPRAARNEDAVRCEGHVRYTGRSLRSSVRGRYARSASDRIGSRAGHLMPIVGSLQSTPCWSSATYTALHLYFSSATSEMAQKPWPNSAGMNSWSLLSADSSTPTHLPNV